MVCGTIANGLEVIKKYKEVPIFLGNDYQHDVTNLNVIVLVNKETQTYTVALVSKEQNKFCSVSAGEGINLPKDASSY